MLFAFLRFLSSLKIWVIDVIRLQLIIMIHWMTFDLVGSWMCGPIIPLISFSSSFLFSLKVHAKIRFTKSFSFLILFCPFGVPVIYFQKPQFCPTSPIHLISRLMDYKYFNTHRLVDVKGPASILTELNIYHYSLQQIYG